MRRPRSSRSARARWLVVAGLAAIVVGGWGVWHWLDWRDYRSFEARPGTVFALELPPVVGPFDGFGVFAVDWKGPAIAVVDRGTSSRPRTFVVHRYPSGERLERRDDYSTDELAALEARGITMAPFDFDGDGDDDAIVKLEHSIEVRSGSADSPSVLFASDEPREYVTYERFTLLPDVDGDGWSELAVLQPRTDRSTWDFAPLDARWTAQSRLCVVSGKLASAARR
ncbi:MAG: hypothetical protein L6Q99_04385 [Planctomycetes bacterium]|nr:hypothetical protein [Planctomycetota bacterium]